MRRTLAFTYCCLGLITSLRSSSPDSDISRLILSSSMSLSSSRYSFSFCPKPVVNKTCDCGAGGCEAACCGDGCGGCCGSEDTGRDGDVAGSGSASGEDRSGLANWDDDKSESGVTVFTGAGGFVCAAGVTGSKSSCSGLL